MYQDEMCKFFRQICAFFIGFSVRKCGFGKLIDVKVY